MTGKEFFNAVANSRIDLVQVLLDILDEVGADYCIVGGLAVNAYAEPVVSLDLDLVVAIEQMDRVCKAADSRDLKVETFSPSINRSSPQSDLRIQLQIDPRYQTFISRAEKKFVLGYDLMVAAIADVLQGKIWAYQDEQRRRSKRQKDLADMIRLIEAQPDFESKLPGAIRERIE